MNDIPRHTLAPPPHLDLCDPQLASRFDDSFVRALPADPVQHDVPRPVRNACYSRVKPTPVAAPELLAWADAVGDLLGIARPDSATGPVADVLGGNRVLPGMQPYAARYGGHQFGNWAGQLGDGRAMTLVEVIGPDGRRRELQLKGAGRTPYSRRADGRAVLRSSVREFLCSEAMHYLGVPTTRALSLVATGEPVERDMFYDGNAQDEPGAIVCRVAPSFVRFGNFEILAANEELEELKRLADYVIRTHYPELGEPSPGVYARWFEEICRRTAVMVADWMRVGFVHGVMNTDNMSILGLTIDYGPYGFIEGFDWGHICNHSDDSGRYAYNMQPRIAHWNLYCLAQALLPLIEMEAAESALEEYEGQFERNYSALMRAKFGLAAEQAGDAALMQDTLALLHQSHADYTTFFRRLGNFDSAAGAGNAPLRELFADRDAYADWAGRYRVRLALEAGTDAVRKLRMDRVNPKYVLRNYLAETAIRKAADQRDYSEIERLMRLLARPYDEQEDMQAYAEPAPQWASALAVSCSS